MKQPGEQVQNRREMFRSALRYLAFGGIGLLSAGLIFRQDRSSTRTEVACPLFRPPLGCGNCTALAGCKLPAAAAARKDIMR